MKDAKHFMLDLEFLDLPSDDDSIPFRPVVISIGIAEFDLSDSPILWQEFNLSHTIEDQLKAGRTIGANTLRWWMAQSDYARAVFNRTPYHNQFSINAGGLNNSVANQIKYRMLAAKDTGYFVWGNPSKVDTDVVAGFVFNGDPPWGFRQVCDFRTLRGAVPEDVYKKYYDGHVSHRAGDDAVQQAKIAKAALRQTLGVNAASRVGYEATPYHATLEPHVLGLARSVEAIIGAQGVELVHTLYRTPYADPHIILDKQLIPLLVSMLEAGWDITGDSKLTNNHILFSFFNDHPGWVLNILHAVFCEGSVFFVPMEETSERLEHALGIVEAISKKNPKY